MIDISVDKKTCIGCTLCRRACPVNAIAITDRKAEINRDNCISCGKCAVVCPTKAIDFPSDYNKVDEMLKNNEKIFLLVAPSFVVHYGDMIEDLLLDWRSCGFDKIAEITYGAKLITKKYQELIKENAKPRYITSTCPVTFDFILKFEKDNIEAIAPVVSPMIAMGMATRKYFPEHKVIFLGPCPAKIVEAREYDVIDAVLTFLEFDKLLKEHRGKIEVEKNEMNETFDNFYDNRSKIYPRSGGLSHIMIEHGILKEGEYVAKDGVLSIKELFEGPEGEYPPHIKFFDVLFCPGGCIGGPGLKSVLSIEEKMQYVDEYRRKTQESDKELIKKFNFNLNDDFDLTPCFCKK
ncbi:MAG: 4Fe-4S binding protein [Nanoarchaeota archaeon]|nr:4Fe-4S binding protein [Nanoarchaeota archaeon]MBU1320910.1 4Fe-4S binding protein [Nanoarchaeota archaeon]MBU2441932.1 4Fe-4S binding protein [Nanoarchaeota archaeon]